MKINKKNKISKKNISGFENDVIEFRRLKNIASQDSAIQKIMQMKEAGLLPRPSFNLEYGPDLRINQLTNLK